jgi:ADP-heptose:LPS heptosyltransferase
MTGVLESLPRGGRMAVIRLRSLGDCVLTTPAIALLKRPRPDLEIAVVVEDRFRAVFEGNPDVASILPPAIGPLRRWAPCLCLNLHGGGASAKLTALSGAPRRAGFAHFRYAFLYNLRIPRAQEILRVDRKVHTAEHVASAAFYLGGERGEIPRARLFAEKPAPGPAYAVIHPFASEPAKTWRASGFQEIARRLEGELEPVFIGGAGEDLSAFARWRALAGAPLGEMKSLLSGAALFVGNDSGPAHMAAAFGLPVLAIFGNSDRDVWRPWKTDAEVLWNPAGIDAITEREVFRAIDRLRVHA